MTDLFHVWYKVNYLLLYRNMDYLNIFNMYLPVVEFFE